MDLRDHLTRLVVESSGGAVSRAELDAAGGSLTALGYSSLAYMRLIDAIENELGVYVDPDADPHVLSTVDKLVEHVGG
ncbi:hypothetical protein GCM10022247_66760 [Allokutzneria multivorans]|uniref:Carrier domain-containing protein n=1 Tax=Allokutzneria multivorans TaxID=1142134 RepID=A0ABP7TX72_9PSEU